MLSLILMAAASCIAPTSDALVGLWESRDTSRGGIGHTLEFRNDGTAIASTTVIVNAFYVVKEGKLLVGETADSPKQPGPHIEIRDNALVETHTDGSTLTKERMGQSSSAGPSIVGAWRYQHYTGVSAYERYTDDGRMHFRLPMSAYAGCYSVSKGKLSMTAPKESTTGFEIRNDELMLDRDGREPTTYRRVRGGLWYPRDPEALRAQAEALAAQD